MNGLSVRQGSVASMNSQTPLERKLTGVSQEFESLLLGQWLKDAESSFGSVPGSEDADDADGSEMKEFAMQHLATEITQKGGIGISDMVKGFLVKSAGTNQHGVEDVREQCLSTKFVTAPSADTRKSESGASHGAR